MAQEVQEKVKPILKSTGFNHVVLYTTDTHRARKFYTELLGLEVAYEDDRQLFMWVSGDPSEEQHLVFFNFGVPSVAARADIDTRQGEELNHLCFQIDEPDLEKVERLLNEYGVKVLYREGVDDELYFNDPDGHRLQVKMLGQPIKGGGQILTKGYEGPVNWKSQS